MTTPLWCLVVLMVMPYVLAVAGGIARSKLPEGIDNNHPRLQYARLEGAGARIWSAQQNAWEALVLFIAAAGVAKFAGVSAEDMACACLVYAGARVLHAVFYIANWAILRSLVQFVGLGACIYLFRLAVVA